MKGFEIILCHGDAIYLEAEGYTADAEIAFYRDGDVFARFAHDVVQRVQECRHPPPEWENSGACADGIS